MNILIACDATENNRTEKIYRWDNKLHNNKKIHQQFKYIHYSFVPMRKTVYIENAIWTIPNQISAFSIIIIKMWFCVLRLCIVVYLWCVDKIVFIITTFNKIGFVGKITFNKWKFISNASKTRLLWNRCPFDYFFCTWVEFVILSPSLFPFDGYVGLTAMCRIIYIIINALFVKFVIYYDYLYYIFVSRIALNTNSYLLI